jgi:hypothetical protein
LAAGAARTKVELPDIVNVLLEELVRHRYELPPLATLSRIASHARSQLNEAIYRAFTESLDEPLRSRLDDLFKTRAGRTPWDELKREPKRPGPREVTSFLKHIQTMTAQADGLPTAPNILSVPKRMQRVTEARALDVHEMRALSRRSATRSPCCSSSLSCKRRSTTSPRSSSRPCATSKARRS